ncbi:uncharacterized protein LOC114434639 isoform X2 [Parambassis ranga]|uniref:Uncharacterized protein LOC114434639 isoform X2 n=1 Tax=Parambassis ranga TaxID=210632 RepID=A0A6P7HVM2_9TELE|nr:uncharacterized protein LOC114434639 isoform X2 [Parambassis ranga]
MGSEYQPLSCAESCRSLFIETTECFICKDGEVKASDPLKNFCDCKNLLAHHMCLSTWIQRGCGSEDRLRCIICKAKYQLQRNSPWRSVSFQWQTWLVLIVLFALMGLVPYVVHCLMTAFTKPPPPSTFKVAAASFGILTEILLIRCLWSFLSGRYRRAEQTAFTVQPRGSEEEEEDDRNRSGRWDGCEATSAAAAAGHASSAASLSQVQERKVDVLKRGCLSFF